MKTHNSVRSLFMAIVCFSDFISCQTTKSNQVSVIFQNDGVPSPESYLRFLKNFPELLNVSICFKVKLKQEREHNTILTYATEDFDNELYIVLHDDELRVLCCNESSLLIKEPLKIRLMKWVSICVVMNLESKLFESVIDGIYSNQSIKSNGNLLIRSGGALYFGQDQDLLGGGFSPTQSLRGQVADFSLFNSILSSKEMVSYTTCGSDHFSIDSTINFKDLNKDFEQSKVVVKYDLKSDDPCKEILIRTILLTEPRNRFDAANICHALGANLTVPLTKEENKALFDKGSMYHNECFTANTDYLWIGAMGNQTDQTFRHYFTEDILENAYRVFDENITDKLCVAMFSSPNDLSLWFGGWSLSDCNLRKCTPCTFKEVRILRMRGLCLQSNFDRNYFVYEFGNTVTLLGTMNSIIKKVSSGGVPNSHGFWEIRTFNKPLTIAQTPLKSPIDYPTGRHVWTIDNDNCRKESMTLALTICRQGQFSCSDGSCIPLDNRCDLQIDCEDGSDEDECKSLVLPSQYSSSISPPRESSSSPLEVCIHVEVYSMISFELPNFKFTTDTEVKMIWNDERLKFKNLKKAISLNNIGSGSQLPWMPNFEILGGGNTSSNFKERKFSLMARRLSEPLPDDDQNVGEDEVFSGDSNPLIMAKKLTIETSCQFDLSYFPFDNQYCDMIFLMSDTTKHYAELTPSGEGVIYSGNRKLSEYFVVSVKMLNFTKGLYSGKKIQFVFENLYTFYVTSTYIPALIMLIIGCSTFYFPLKDFQDRVMVAITALLVDAAFFTQVSTSIPKTSYLKLIDIWFVFCISVLFFVILALTVINFVYFFNECALFVRVTPKYPPYMSSAKNRMISSGLSSRLPEETGHVIKAIRINRFFAIFFPVTILFFMIIYFTLCISQ